MRQVDGVGDNGVEMASVAEGRTMHGGMHWYISGRSLSLSSHQLDLPCRPPTPCSVASSITCAGECHWRAREAR